MQNEQAENTLKSILLELNELHSLLNEEKVLLADSDFDKITHIADLKKQIITSIELNNSKLKAILSLNTSDDSEISIHEIITKNIPNNANLWVEIESLLKICKDKNSINGIILSNNRRQIQQSISILQGQSNEVLTYGATGESIVNKSSVNLPQSV